MSALPSSAAAVDSRTLPTPAAGSLPAAAVAGQHALPTDETHANTALLARTAVSVVPLDSAVHVLPIGVTPIAAAAAVVELQAAAGAPLPSPSSADSAKSLAGASLGSSAQPQAEGQQSSGSRDNGEKLFSSPSPAPIASDPKAMLITSTAQSQPVQPRGLISSPSPSSGAAAASSGVGAGSAAAKISSAAPPSLSAAFAAAELTFRQHKASPPSSAAAAQHNAMCDDDGASAAASCPAALSDSARNCLVIDIQQIASSDKDCTALNTIRNKSGLSWEGKIAAVLEWLPALEKEGLVWVGKDSRFARLHLHFKNHSFLVSALKAVPFLVRCCVPSTGSAWGGYSCPCSELTRYEQPEALHFAVDPTETVPAQPGVLLSTIKDFLKRISVDVQLVWQSSQGGGQRANVPHQRITFWVLPREADQNALVALINRVHQKHTLFGGAISVQGPNTKKTVRCPECRELGHQGDACPKFSGTAVRLRFKDPLSPYDFRLLLEGSHCRSAMLGNTHSDNDWAPSHKATLFFDEPTSEEAIASFTKTLQELTARCSGRLFEHPSFVIMTQSQRKLECLACGDRDKVHQCLSKSTAPSRPSVPQQQQPSAGKTTAAAAAASPAAASAPAAAAYKEATTATTAAAPTYVESLLKGMCGEWRKSRSCENRGRCKRTHPEEWVIIPDSICNDFLKHGSCKWAENCRFPHITFEKLKSKAASSTSTAAVAPVAAPKAAAAAKAASNKKAAMAAPRGGGGNMFAPLAPVAAAASAAPTTPRKAPPLSSLDSLASPSSSGLTRSRSTPSTTPNTSAKKKLTLGAGASAAAAASTARVDQDGFQLQKQKQNKRRRTTASQEPAEQAEEEEKEQTSRKAAKPAAAQRQADAISVSSNDMEE